MASEEKTVEKAVRPEPKKKAEKEKKVEKKQVQEKKKPEKKVKAKKVKPRSKRYLKLLKLVDKDKAYSPQGRVWWISWT